MASAPFLRSVFWASNSALRAWKNSRLALVARSAFFLGRRKLRAKPSLTRTSSPIWPSFSTRASRITCMAGPSLHDIGQERHEAGALDGVGQDALLLVADRGDAGRHDLAALGNEALQQLHILVIDLGRVIAGERAGLLATEEGTAGAVLASATAAFAVAAASAVTIATTSAFAAAVTVATIAHTRTSSASPSRFAPSGLSSPPALPHQTSHWSPLTVL